MRVLLDYHAAGLLDAQVRFRVEQSPARGRLSLAGRPLSLPAPSPSTALGGARTQHSQTARQQQQQPHEQQQQQMRPSFSVVDLKRRALRYEHDASEEPSDALVLALEFGAAAAGGEEVSHVIAALPSRPVLVTLPIAIIGNNDVPRFVSSPQFVLSYNTNIIHYEV